MDSLRITLLIIGCLFILGIYLWEILSKPKQRKNSDILDAVDELPDVAESPLYSVSMSEQNGFETHNSEVTNLGNLLAQSRSEDFNTDGLSVSMKDNVIEEESEESLPLQMSVNAYEASMEKSENEASDNPAIIEDVESPVIQDEVIYDDEPENETDSLEQIPETSKADEDLLVLYVMSPRQTMFNGLSISKAADEVGMIYGHMNVFHHFGPGKLHSGQPLFSMANMYEPGSFDLGKMAELKTKGIAMFMYSPASIDANVVFELFLNTTQRLSQYLGGDILTVEHKPLNNSEIKLLREQAEMLSDS